MENIDLTQSLPAGVTSYLGAGGIIIISAIIILLFIFIKNYKGKIAPLLLGILSYVVFMIMGYNLIVTLCFMIPGFTASYEYNEILFTILFLVVFVLLMTVGRIVSIKIMQANYDQAGDMLNFGLGLGVCDAIICAFSTLTLMIYATGINNVGMEALFKDFTEAEIISSYNTISSLFTSPVYFWAILGLSAVIDLILNCGLAIIVFGAVTKKIPSWWYMASAGMNFAVILPFKLYDTSSSFGIIFPFAIKTILFMASILVIYKVDNKFLDGMIAFKSKKLYSTDKKMPKFGKLSNK